MLEHNKIVYDEVIERLKTSSRVCIVQATGTGKGVIASSLIEDYENVLVIAPTNAILENYRMNLGVNSENVIFYTYQGISMLLNNQIEELGEKVSLIILDEFHRIGAETWGRKVEMLCDRAEAKGCKTVGLSATPVRYLDNERDMSEEFFKGNVVNGLNIVDAVVSGVLPTFKYVVSYYGYERDLFDKIKEDKLVLSSDIKTIISNLENNYSIGKVIQKETKELGENQKWVVFFNTIDELEDFKSCINTWFCNKINLFILHSQNNFNGNMEILKEFNIANNGINVLLCVDMLNEGVHIKNLDGVIMIRKTVSPIVYLQQLGRALQIGGKNPIIFDFIGNYRRMNRYENLSLNFIEEINNRLPITEKEDKVYNKIIVSSYCEEISEISKRIKDSLYPNNDWKPEEDEILFKYYPSGGTKLCKEKGLERTVEAIYGRANTLNLRFSPVLYAWTEEEYDIVKRYYPLGGSELCIENGINKSKDEIKYVANKILFIKKINWTEEQDNILRKYYHEFGSRGCIKNGLVGKNALQIQGRAKILGLSYEKYKGDNIWTEEEIKILYKYYSKYGARYCMENGLSNKSLQSICGKANKLGIKVESFKEPFSEIEIDIIMKYYTIGKAKLCKEKGLNRSLQSIQQKAGELGLTKNVAKVWTEEELKILKKYYYEGGSDLCIEKGLNRDRKNIMGMASKCGIHRKKEVWTDEEKELLKLYWNNGGWRVCQEKGLGHKTKRNLEYMADLLGITQNRRWTKEEDEVILKYYSIGGSSLCIENGVNKTSSAIQQRAHILNVNKGFKRKEYSDMKDKAVELYKNGGENSVRNYFKDLGLNNNQIGGLLSYLTKIGLREPLVEYVNWKDSDIEIVKKYYPLEGINVINRLNGYSKKAVRCLVSKLNIHFNDFQKSDFYSEEEDEIIRTYYPTEGTFVYKRLNNRTPDAVRCRARRLGIKVVKLDTSLLKKRDFSKVQKWTEEEVEILKKYYPLEGKKVSERLLNRNECMVSKKASSLGIRRIK